MATQTHMGALLQRMLKMSAADISVLEAASKTPGSGMTTTPSSANDALWSETQELGWTTVKGEELPLGEGKSFLLRVFTITPAGSQPISELLAAYLETRRSRQAEYSN